MSGLAPLARAADFQAAWYLSLLIFGMGALVVSGFSLAQVVLRPMWRAGDRSLALLVGAVASLTTMFFVALLLTATIGLLRRAFGA